MRILKKITTISLALIVLFSTFSFTVETHYCGDFLVDVSLTGDLKSCGSEIPSEAIVKMKNCCKDEIIHFEGQKELKQQYDTFDVKKQQFLIAFYKSYETLFEAKLVSKSCYETKPPPDIPVDFQVAYQTFLL